MTTLFREAWRGLARALGRQAPVESERRWVVVDVETTGLDPERDALLSVGAVALQPDGIDLTDSFEAFVRPPVASARDNILIHRIGAQAQVAGEPPEIVCDRFLRFVGESPLVGFHASFDRDFLSRAMMRARLTPPAEWLDLAELAPAVHPGTSAHALDDWLEVAHLAAMTRHSAASDALVTAMLFQWLLARVRRQDRTVGRLRKLARGARWVAASGRPR